MQVVITMLAIRRDTTTQGIACLPGSIPDQINVDCWDDLSDADDRMPYPKSAGIWAWHDVGSTRDSQGYPVWRGEWKRLTPDEATELVAGRTPWGHL
jgi:hypothetical protein